MPDIGLTLSPRNYARTGEAVLAYENQPRNIIKHRRRTPHVPSVGESLYVYQALYPIRLRRGTLYHPDDVDKSEPAIICTRIASSGESSPKLLWSRDISDCYNALDGAGIVSGYDNRIQESTFDHVKDSGLIDPIVRDRLGSFGGLYLLRARWIQSYVYSGCPIIGNDEEALFSLGRSRLLMGLTASMDQDDDVGVATLINTDNTASGSRTVEETVLVRDPLQWNALYIPANSDFDISAEFVSQSWFGDETAESPEAWYNHADEGWLPVLSVDPATGRDVIGKTDGSVTAPASVTVSVYSGSSSAGLADTGDNITVYDRFGDISSTKWVSCKAYPHGWEATAAQC